MILAVHFLIAGYTQNKLIHSQTLDEKAVVGLPLDLFGRPLSGSVAGTGFDSITTGASQATKLRYDGRSPLRRYAEGMKKERIDIRSLFELFSRAACSVA